MRSRSLYITLGIVLLLAVFVVAAPTIKDKDKSFKQEHKDALERINLSEYDYDDYYLDADTAQRCLHKSRHYVEIVQVINGTVEVNKTESIINTCNKFPRFEDVCSSANPDGTCNFTREYHTDAEMEAIMDIWEVGRLEGIADATIDREGKALAGKEHKRKGKNKNKQK